MLTTEPELLTAQSSDYSLLGYDAMLFGLYHIYQRLEEAAESIFRVPYTVSHPTRLYVSPPRELKFQPILPVSKLDI
jgi:hypothetical protein